MTPVLPAARSLGSRGPPVELLFQALLLDVPSTSFLHGDDGGAFHSDVDADDSGDHKHSAALVDSLLMHRNCCQWRDLDLGTLLLCLLVDDGISSGPKMSESDCHK